MKAQPLIRTVWPIVPLLPVIGIILAVMGWVPNGLL